MIEIRIHGRGGQGAVIASEILADSFFAQGQSVQTFPEFGVERRGAPVAAYLRIDTKPIRLRCRIYKPDHIVVLDPVLLNSVDVTVGLKDGGWILINSNKEPDQMKFPKRFNVATVDATGVAIKYRLGARTAPIVNTAILGAVCRLPLAVKLNIDTLRKAISEGVPFDPATNVKAAEEAAKIVKSNNKLLELSR
ncbi:MAG: 2-oxoacid:acceptor oxidoreductase family protein [Candidatus Brocadiia bacterium]